MEQIPNSYGTGRDPDKKDSHRIPIALLLLCCVAIHGFTFLYLSQKPDTSKKETPILSLDEFSEELPTEQTLVEDCWGLGLQLGELSDMQQRYWDLPEGVFVEQIEKDSAAYAAGLRSGDLLLQVGQQEVENLEECQEAFESYRRQEQLDLTYYREGKEYSISVSREELPES